MSAHWINDELNKTLLQKTKDELNKVAFITIESQWWSIFPWRMVMSMSTLSKWDEDCLRHLLSWNQNEMARLSDGLGRERERSTGFSGALHLTHANLALKIQLLNSWTKIIVRLQVIVNTDAYDCVCFASDSSPFLIARELSCVFVMMIVTWSMGLSFNDVHPHHHLQWCFLRWSLALLCNK